MSNIGLLNVHQYSSYFLDRDKKLDLDYELAVEDNDYYDNVAKFGGSQTLVDTPLEIALLSYSAGVVDIRPAKAVEMLPANNPKLADLKLGAATYMEMQMARFSGKDAAPYAAALKFITDRSQVSEADIRKFMAQGIAAEVDAQFNKVSFLLRGGTRGSYNAVLTRNTNNQYILSYEDANDVVNTLPPANSLEALSSAMRNSGDFSQSAIDAVREQAALIPAVVFDGWKKSTQNMITP
ncbi:MAG: hypothetical protein LBL50_01730 [Candidatus Margulisbacteria bacterium]|jgi:hypothetical protein|nr:hypothetical protein [Candidatus Margulisiibacteriota bacterium]